MTIERNDNDIDIRLMDFYLHNQAEEFPAPLNIEEQKTSYGKVREELPTPKSSVREHSPELNALLVEPLYVYSRLMRDGIEHWLDITTYTMRRSYASYKAFIDSCQDLMRH